MARFGGMGGLSEGREPNQEDAFEMTIARVFGERIKTDDEFCTEMWSALANVDWYNTQSHDEASYSFRAAGDLIAAIRGSGSYLDWYCSGEYATITEEIRRTLKKEGWLPDATPAICDEPGCLKDVGSIWHDGERSRSTCYQHTGEHRPPKREEG